MTPCKVTLLLVFLSAKAGPGDVAQELICFLREVKWILIDKAVASKIILGAAQLLLPTPFSALTLLSGLFSPLPVQSWFNKGAQ